MKTEKMRQKIHNILRRLIGKEIPYYKVYGINIKDEFGRKVNLWTPLIKGYGNINVTVFGDDFKMKDVEKSEPIFEYVSMRDDYNAIENLSDKVIPELYKKLKSLKLYIYIPEGWLTFWRTVAEWQPPQLQWAL
jgi:hypothetical protein